MKENYKGIEIEITQYNSVVNHAKFFYIDERLISGMTSQHSLLKSAKQRIDYLIGDVEQVPMILKIKLSISGSIKVLKRRAKNLMAKKSRIKNRK